MEALESILKRYFINITWENPNHVSVSPPMKLPGAIAYIKQYVSWPQEPLYRVRLEITEGLSGSDLPSWFIKLTHKKRQANDKVNLIDILAGSDVPAGVGVEVFLDFQQMPLEAVKQFLSALF